MNVFEKLEMIKDEAKQLINDSSTVEDLKQLKVKYLGKKGPIQEAMTLMRDLPDEEKPKVGQLANQIKQLITDFLNTQMASVEANLMALELEKAKIDITLPGRLMKEGYHHPLSLIIEEIEDLFIAMEYQVVEGPELETDYYNFELLNLPQDHPARDMQDTFYIDMKHLLRTHTSPVQARTMQALEEKQPIRIICPGKTYRRDDDDATHSHQFIQVEGLVIDKDITMADLKGTLDYFVKAMFGQKREIRFRPSYFPFTEPSVEVDISCAHCQGKGCSTCKQTGWIEVLGAGMVHPNVLLMGGFDPEVYQGFAFGIGIERIAMLRYGIDNIRHFYTNDLRFLKQFE